MANAANRIRELVRESLTAGEMRHLSLVVAVRKGLAPDAYKGDLGRSVNVAIQELIRANAVAETDGMYGLTAAGRKPTPQVAPRETSRDSARETPANASRHA